MKRRIVVGLVTALAALAVGVLPTASAQAAGAAHFKPVTIAKSGTVLVRTLPRKAAPGLERSRKPVLRLTDNSTPGPPSSVATTQPAVGTTTTTAEQVLSSFAGAGLDLQIPLGTDQFVTPPDPQIAAGPTQLVEMVNSSGSVWDKQGNLLQLFDLNRFFLVPSGYSFSDPRVIFDSDSQRWWASGVAFIPPTYASVVVIAVSTSADATGTWFQYTAANSSSLTHDQPKFGVSSDKFVVTWNDFFEAQFFEGQSTWVLQKSEMLTGSGTVHGSALGPDSSRSSLVPAVQLTSQSDQYIVYNGTDCRVLGGNCIAAIGVVRITGTPLQGNVAWNETDPFLAATSGPPAADQPGMSSSIATNDDRFLTAVLENGVIWTGGNDACLPANDNATRPCSRLVQVLTAGPAVNQNFDIASTGGGLYFPAFAMDSAGDMYVVYNISSTAQNIGVRITGQVAGAPVQTVAPGQTIRAGDATYNMNPCFGTNQTSRWGDYNGAAIDPTNPANVWVSAEFAASGNAANGDVGCDWATFAAQLSFGTVPAATLTSISPTSGPSAGGTSVTFTGSGFDVIAGTTSFAFGSAAATAVSCSSNTTCTGTSPAGSGTVTVTATVDGAPASGSAPFTYTGPPVPTLSSISPSSGPAAGGTTVTFNGAAFDTAPGATTFAFGGAAATGVTCSSSSTCSGTSPAGIGSVNVTAMVDGAQAAGSPNFTYISSLTSISPTSGPEGGGTNVTFNGTGFDVAAGRTTFVFGGVAATGVTCSSSTTCTGASPAGTGTVAVSGTVDGIPASGAVTFAYLTPPGLNSISPTSGPAAGGTTVTFFGRGFDVAPGQTSFSFGAKPATGVSCSSSTTCTGTSPAGAGAVPVTATVDGAPVAGTVVFIYVPSMSAITPSTAPAGSTVTITGTGFDTAAGNTQFKFGNALATNVQCSSNTTCTVVVPSGNGNVTVTVTVDGQQGSNSLTFHYRKR